jgi:hypothetical protein
MSRFINHHNSNCLYEGRMKPKIDKTKFGSITVNGEKFDYDILIRLDKKVEKRKKKLSKEVYGTSHTISKAEAEYVYEKGAEKMIIGSGQSGLVSLSDEAVEFFKQKNCQVDLLPTPEAIERWNKTKGQTIGLFHITC